MLLIIRLICTEQVTIDTRFLYEDPVTLTEEKVTNYCKSIFKAIELLQTDPVSQHNNVTIESSNEVTTIIEYTENLMHDSLDMRLFDEIQKDDYNSNTFQYLNIFLDCMDTFVKNRLSVYKENPTLYNQNVLFMCSVFLHIRTKPILNFSDDDGNEINLYKHTDFPIQKILDIFAQISEEILYQHLNKLFSENNASQIKQITKDNYDLICSKRDFFGYYYNIHTQPLSAFLLLCANPHINISRFILRDAKLKSELTTLLCNRVFFLAATKATAPLTSADKINDIHDYINNNQMSCSEEIKQILHKFVDKEMDNIVNILKPKIDKIDNLSGVNTKYKAYLQGEIIDDNETTNQHFMDVFDQISRIRVSYDQEIIFSQFPIIRDTLKSTFKNVITRLSRSYNKSTCVDALSGIMEQFKIFFDDSDEFKEQMEIALGRENSAHIALIATRDPKGIQNTLYNTAITNIDILNEIRDEIPKPVFQTSTITSGYTPNQPIITNHFSTPIISENIQEQQKDNMRYLRVSVLIIFVYNMFKNQIKRYWSKFKRYLRSRSMTKVNTKNQNNPIITKEADNDILKRFDIKEVTIDDIK